MKDQITNASFSKIENKIYAKRRKNCTSTVRQFFFFLSDFKYMFYPKNSTYQITISPLFKKMSKNR